jgi:hypothetical protein
MPVPSMLAGDELAVQRLACRQDGAVLAVVQLLHRPARVQLDRHFT